MLKVSNNKHLRSISVTTSVDELYLTRMILDKFTIPGVLANNYLDHEIQEFVKHVLKIYTDYILMPDELSHFYECFTKIEIYETEEKK